MGKVILVGAGAGDTGLLTIKGKKYIEEADCIIYDRLASPELLEMAKHDCECIYVGKENHKHIMKQDAINELLYKKSREYSLVVRLKGGDPYVFGRGGEEALYLRKRKIDIEVVPGVSSVVAALADAGIPITHRGIAKGFQVITAHSKKDEEAQIDYTLLTDESMTCVFLMGLAHVEHIAEELIRTGRRPDTPAAVISNGTLATQKKCIGTLESIGYKVKCAKLESPAIIVVGNVVSLNDQLDFFEKRPLFGRKITVPYIEAMGERTHFNKLITDLQQLGADVDTIMVGKILPIPISDFEKEISSSDWILFTSRNGVRAFFYNMKFNDTDIRCLAKIRFGVVGKATEQELKNYQIKADLVPDEQTGAGLAKALKKQISDQTKVCIFSAKEASEDLERELQKFCHVIKTDAYENVNVSEQDYILKPADTVISEAVFTSASNVERFFQMLTEEIMVERAYSIGKKTTEALKKKNVMNICESEESTYDSVVSLITKK